MPWWWWWGREGYPCRLYFDVEFEVVDNPGLDGDRLVGVLLAMAAHRLHKVSQPASQAWGTRSLIWDT